MANEKYYSLKSKKKIIIKNGNFGFFSEMLLALYSPRDVRLYKTI